MEIRQEEPLLIEDTEDSSIPSPIFICTPDSTPLNLNRDTCTLAGKLVSITVYDSGPPLHWIYGTIHGHKDRNALWDQMGRYIGMKGSSNDLTNIKGS